MVALLREVLIDLARSPEPDHERLLRAPDGAGKRQFVLGGDVIALAAMALLGYFLHRTGGKKSEAKKRAVERRSDGQIVIVTEAKATYFDPLSPLGKLFAGFARTPPAKTGDNE